MFPFGAKDAVQLVGALALTILVASYFVSTFEGEVEVLVSHRALKNTGLLLGALYLIYVAEQFASSIVIK